MARRKNTRFIDPRYFMDEKMEKIEESQWQDNLDADAKCAKKYKRNTPEYEDCLTKEGIPLEEGGCAADPSHQLADQLGIDHQFLVDAIEKIVDSYSQEVSVEEPPELYDDEDEEYMMEGNRTAKGNITQDAREKHATVGKDKFPIFDKKSAEAAIDLRGHAPEADRAKIINKAAKYAPEAAKKAREADKK